MLLNFYDILFYITSIIIFIMCFLLGRDILYWNVFILKDTVHENVCNSKDVPVEDENVCNSKDVSVEDVDERIFK